MSNNKNFKVENGIQAASYYEKQGTVITGGEASAYLDSYSGPAYSPSLASGFNTEGLTLSSDGTRVYYCSISTDTIYEHLLSTPWDITTTNATPNHTIATITEDSLSDPRAITFKSDGTVMYVAGTSTAMQFRRNGAVEGSITLTSTTTSYNTTSDYRLKENVVTDWDATTRLKQLKPSRFNFISEPSKTVDGFLAHEAAEVVPEAVTGEKDATMQEEYEVTPAIDATYDDEGNELTSAVDAVMETRTVPNYQGIDQSKLVPLLVKAVQELEARIATLESAE